jgi:hypothetical protein
MKKTSHSPKTKKTKLPNRSQKIAAPVEDAPLLDVPAEEPDIAADQFAVAGREEEASSSGHRVEPIEEDDEHNAETLIEEGLHGFRRASPNRTHRGS